MIRLKSMFLISALALLGCGSGHAKSESSPSATEVPLSEALSAPEGIERLPALKVAMERRLAHLKEPSYAKEDMLELAYLFHANGYDARARTLYDWLIDRTEGAEEGARLHYLAADAVKRKGDSAAATAYLEAAIREYRGYPLAFARLGDARLKANDLSEAETLYHEALSLDDELAPARLGLARVLTRRGEFPEAVRELKILLRTDPQNYNAQALLARALTELGDEQGAFAVTQSVSRSSAPPIEDPWLEPVRASILDPQRLDFLFLDHFVVGEYEKALPYLDKMERIDPGNARYCRYRGIVLMEQERFAQAAAVFREGLKLGGDDKALYPLLVQALMRNGLVAEAETAAREGLAESEPTGELLLELARTLVKREALDEAIKALEEALGISPYDVEAHLLRARVGMWTGAEETAKESLAMVQQLSPSNYIVLVRAALVYLEAGRFAEAVPILDQARRVSPNYGEAINLLADAHVQLGQSLRSAGELDQALGHIEQALHADPKRLEALSAKAQLLIELRRFDLAEAAMGAFLANGGESPATLLIYGDLLSQNGKPAEARSSWMRGLERLGSDGQPSHLRGKLLQRLDR